MINRENKKISKRSMTDDELAYLISKIKHNIDIIESLDDVADVRLYLAEISGWVDEIQNDNFKGYY